MIKGEVVQQTSVPGVTHSITLWSVRGQVNHGRRELLDASCLDQHSRFSVLDHLRRRAAVRSDNRFPVMHRLQKDNPESFAVAGQYKDVARFVNRTQRELINRTEKLYSVCHSQVRGDSFMSFQVTPAANDDVFQISNARAHGGQGLDDGIDILVLLARVQTAN